MELEVTVKKEEVVLDFHNDIIAQKDAEIEELRRKNIELEGEVRVLKDNEKKVDDLMIEINVLGCEKGKAEREAEMWKAKCEELELQLGKMRKGIDSVNKNEEVNVVEDRPAGTFRTETLSKHSTDSEQGSRREVTSRARKGDEISNGGNLQKTISPVTPCSRSSVVIDVKSDSDEDLNCLRFKKRKSSVAIDVKSDSDDDDLNCLRFKKRKSSVAIDVKSDSDDDDLNRLQFKKRRSANRVTSDSESDDDNVPLTKLMRKSSPDLDGDTNPTSNLNGSSSPENLNRSTRKQRLTKQGNRGKEKYEENSPRKKVARTSNRKTVTIIYEDDSGEDESETESMDSFINDSEHDPASSSEEIPENIDTSSGDSGNESQGSMEYGEIMSSLRREKRDTLTWEYEADMLVDFGKSPELCMKAVCALYRQQTSDEQHSKVALVHNKRGFSRFDATPGSLLAEFLTDNNAEGDVVKTVEELLKFDSEGIKQCRRLATHYSKQLFQIYENEEDPHFRP